MRIGQAQVSKEDFNGITYLLAGGNGQAEATKGV